MDCTVVVLPSVPELEIAVGGAKVEVATGGDMSRVGTDSVGTEGTTRSEDGGVRTADMESSEGIESEAGRTSLVKPISINALKTVSGRSSTVPEASNVQVIVVTSPVIPVFRVRHR